MMITFLTFVIFKQCIVILTLIRINHQQEQRIKEEINISEKLKKRLENKNGIKI